MYIIGTSLIVMYKNTYDRIICDNFLKIYIGVLILKSYFTGRIDYGLNKYNNNMA